MVGFFGYNRCMTPDTLALLQTYISAAFPDRPDAQVSNLVSLNTGWESEVSSFTMNWGAPGQQQGEDLILRIYPGMDAYTKSEGEFRALSMLNRVGYPVPRVYCLERDASPFGKPFLIMERIDGKEMWGPMFHSNPFKRRRLLKLFCGLFANLHAIDWRPVVPDPGVFEPGGPHAIIERELSLWQKVVENTLPPGFHANWQWLLDHQHDVISTRASLVHWDFHPNNILLKKDGSGVVIDWTSLDVTDYRFDLAWTLLLIGSNENMRWREPILREYERQAGHPVEDLAFFDVAACLRRLVTVIISIYNGPQTLGMRPGAEALIRKQAPAQRHVYELLLQRTGLPIPEVETFLAECGT